MENIANVIKKATKIAIFVHVSADGDALGSALALKYCLEKQNVLADVFLNEPVSDRLAFLTDISACNYKTDIPEDYDLLVALDCGDESRLGNYKECFLTHQMTVNIDHHFTNCGYAKYNYVDGNAAATGELVLRLLQNMNIGLDVISASLLYAAISSDTGCFAYSNATSKTHLLAAELLKFGIDSAKINKLLFATNTLLELKLQSVVIENLQLYHGGKLSIAYIDEEQLLALGASYEHTEGLIDILRSVKGVEIACLIKQKDGKTKGSVRTNSHVNAAEVAAVFDGGGHIRAAGFSSALSIEDTKEKIISITKTLL